MFIRVKDRGPEGQNGDRWPVVLNTDQIVMIVDTPYYSQQRGVWLYTIGITKGYTSDIKVDHDDYVRILNAIQISG